MRNTHTHKLVLGCWSCLCEKDPEKIFSCLGMSRKLPPRVLVRRWMKGKIMNRKDEGQSIGKVGRDLMPTNPVQVVKIFYFTATAWQFGIFASSRCLAPFGKALLNTGELVVVRRFSTMLFSLILRGV